MPVIVTTWEELILEGSRLEASQVNTSQDPTCKITSTK
jgi:hypothetical protein